MIQLQKEESMPPVFPSVEWLANFENKLNNDDRYAQIAKNWEGDICFVIEPEDNLKEQVIFYLDLWHGSCRKTEVLSECGGNEKPAFILKAKYNNFARIVQGKLDPMQAMMTRRLQVEGSMAYMMRNVPTVLDFVRCAREVTDEIV